MVIKLVFITTALLITQVYCFSINGNNELRQESYLRLCEGGECKHGTCEIYNANTHLCHCPKGITGERCDKLDTTNNPCSARPCYGDAQCVNGGNGEFRCICPLGRTGTRCESNITPCNCMNGGVCKKITADSYTCDCPLDYGGNLCQYLLPKFLTCQSRPCSNFGFCNNNGICICPAKFTGRYCEVEITSSTSVSTLSTGTSSTTVTSPGVIICPFTNVCKNGGTCLFFNNSLFCVCPPNFTGTLCENEGTKTTGAATTSTSTQSTSTSTLTSTQSTATSSAGIILCPFTNVCKNGGTCLFLNNNLFCVCPPNFTGTLCENEETKTTGAATTATTTTSTSTQSTLTSTLTSTQSTATSPSVIICPFTNVCKNGGTCLILNNSLFCLCPPNFSGTLCENEETKTTETATGATATATTGNPNASNSTTTVNPDASNSTTVNPDASNSTTTDLTQSSGPSTSTPLIINCPPQISICQNGGTCQIINESIKCACKSTYSGTFCEKRTEFCDINPCQNSGTCQQTGEYDGSCECAPGYGGIFCESFECKPNPCKNGHECIYDGTDHICLCSEFYEGDYCEHEISKITEAEENEE